MIWTFWLATALAGPVVTADRMAIVADSVQADGSVVIELGDDRLEATRLELDLEAGTAVLFEGTWTRGDLGTLSFRQATIDFAEDTVTGALDGGTLHTGVLKVTGESLVLDEDGQVRGERVVVGCDCEGASPWSVRTRSVVVTLDDSVRFRSAFIRIFDVPLVPVPGGSLPLSRRSGFLFPDVGFGQDGFRARTPLFLTLGDHADVTLTPAVRTARSARLLGEHRFAARQGTGTFRGSFGRDWQTESWRGSGDWTVRLSQGRGTFGTDGQLLSDPQILRDYGDSFLVRASPWTEARALIGWGPIEADLDTFQNAGVVDQRVGRVALRQGARDLGLGILGEADVVGAWEAAGRSFWDTEPATAALSAQGALSRPTVVGPLMIEPAVDAGGWQRQGEASAWSRARLETRLLAWRPTETGVQRLEPRLRIAATAALDQEGFGPVESVLPQPDPVVASAGLLWRQTGENGIVEASADLTTDAEGPRLSHTSWVQSATLSARTQLDVGLFEPDPLALAEVRWTPGPVSLGSRWAYGDPTRFLQPDPADRLLHQVRADADWTLPGPLSSVRLGGGLGYDLGIRALNSNTARIAWTHPTGCLRLRAGARFDRDRALPDAFFGAELLPR